MKYSVLKTLFVITLFLMFLIFFGVPSTQHYLNKAVFIEVDNLEFDDLEFPVISLCPLNPSSHSSNKGGWLKEDWMEKLCTRDNFSSSVQCIKQSLYDLDESIFNVTRGRNTDQVIPVTDQHWSTSYTHVGYCHTFTLDQRSCCILKHINKTQTFTRLGANLLEDSIRISLNNQLGYRVYIYDPFFFEFSANPQLFPGKTTQKLMTIVKCCIRYHTSLQQTTAWDNVEDHFQNSVS